MGGVREERAQQGKGARIGELRRVGVREEDEAVRGGARGGPAGDGAGDAQILQGGGLSSVRVSTARTMAYGGRAALTRTMRLMVPVGKNRPSSSW